MANDRQMGKIIRSSYRATDPLAFTAIVNRGQPSGPSGLAGLRTVPSEQVARMAPAARKAELLAPAELIAPVELPGQPAEEPELAIVDDCDVDEGPGEPAEGDDGQGDGDAGSGSADGEPSEVDEELGRASKLATRGDFERFAARDDLPGAAGVLAMKFLVVGVDTQTPQVWLADAARYDYHYDFATMALGVTLSLAAFNRVTYFTDTRQFIAGTVVAHDAFVDDDGNQGAYALEFWPTDPVKAPHVKIAFELLAQALPFSAGKFAYHPAGDTQEELAESEAHLLAAAGVPVLSTDRLFQGVTYSPLNQATGLGVLRVVDPTQPQNVPFSPRDVVLFKGSTPNDLTHVAGIITEVPQTPLSHINLKAKQDHVPNAYIKDALQQPAIAALVGKPVKYEVRSDGYELSPATQQEIDAFEEQIRPPKPQQPKGDVSVEAIAAFADLRVQDALAYGSKTTNLAELSRLLDAGQTPAPGFGVPFSFYDTFMKYNGFHEQAAEMMAHPSFTSDIAHREEALEKFRKALRKGKVPATLKAALAALQAQYSDGANIRLRSSTNNEDLAGFSGAGLYDSYTCRTGEDETLPSEIRKVWASIWNFRAFEERDFWRIPHDKALMAVTVHPNVDDELANGVAITRNIYDENWPGFYISAQVGENLVTNPDPLSVPEEMLISAIGEHYEYEVQRIRKSSDNGGAPVLNHDQLQALVTALEKIQAHFKLLLGKQADKTFAMDVEWKILPTGLLQVKQARPVVG